MSDNNGGCSLVFEGLGVCQSPILTIAIPTYNRPDMLFETLRSLSFSSFEDLANVEIIISDNDVGQNRVSEILSKFSGLPIRYYKNSVNLGMIGNWNNCLALSRGKYVTILHDDDVFVDSGLSSMLSQINVDPCDVCFFKTANYYQRKDGGDILSFSRRDDIFMLQRQAVLRKRDFVLGNPVNATLGVVFSRAAFLSVGEFDSDFYPVCDYHMWVKFITNRSLDIRFSNQVVAVYRIFDGGSCSVEVIDGFVEKTGELRCVLLRYLGVRIPSILLTMLGAADRQILKGIWLPRPKFNLIMLAKVCRKIIWVFVSIVLSRGRCDDEKIAKEV